MVEYKCFKCGNKVTEKIFDQTSATCPKCGSKIFVKPRTKVKTIKAI